MPYSTHSNTNAEESLRYSSAGDRFDLRNLIMSGLFLLRWDSEGKDLSFGGYLFSRNNKCRFNLVDLSKTELLNTIILFMNNSLLLSSQFLFFLSVDVRFLLYFNRATVAP